MKLTETQTSVVSPPASSLDLLPTWCGFACVLHQFELINFIGCLFVCLTVLLIVYGLRGGSVLHIERFTGEVPTCHQPPVTTSPSWHPVTRRLLTTTVRCTEPVSEVESLVQKG